jgi:taurine dioxygenase
MGYEVSPLPGQSEFGAVITGFKPEMIDEPKIRQALYDLWIDKGVIVFKDLTGMDTHIRLSEIFGEPEVHPLLRNVDVPRENKLIIDIDSDASAVYIVDGKECVGWLAWHKDSMYTDKINHGGILAAIEVPEEGGETGFIDQVAAYKALPEDLKQRIGGLNVIYRFTIDSCGSKFGDKPEDRLSLPDVAVKMSDGFNKTLVRSIHPMVAIQPGTGRKFVNISPWFADGIEGMENAEGDALLREVIAHNTRPERIYKHKYAPNEMVLWDNWRMLHCAFGTPLGMKRHMRRTTLFGDYGQGRLEEAAVAAE